MLTLSFYFIAMGQVQQKSLAGSAVQLWHWPHLGGWTEDCGVPSLQQTVCLGEQEAAVTRGREILCKYSKHKLFNLGQLR